MCQARWRLSGHACQLMCRAAEGPEADQGEGAKSHGPQFRTIRFGAPRPAQGGAQRWGAQPVAAAMPCQGLAAWQRMLRAAWHGGPSRRSTHSGMVHASSRSWLCQPLGAAVYSAWLQAQCNAASGAHEHACAHTDGAEPPGPRAGAGGELPAGAERSARHAKRASPQRGRCADASKAQAPPRAPCWERLTA